MRLTGVDLDEAQEVFFDTSAIDSFDLEHSTPGQPRYDIVGVLITPPSLFVAGKQKPSIEGNMKTKTYKPMAKDVTIIVTQKDYDREMRAGVKPDETFKPGIHKGRRGGFLERHPEALREKLESKIGIYIKLDRDILEFFKKRAGKTNAAPYQTQINNALRIFMDGMQDRPDFSELLENETFIAAVAERVSRKDPSRTSA